MAYPFLSLSICLIFILTAVAFSAALLSIRTADAGLPALFGANDIADDRGYHHRKDSNNNIIDHTLILAAFSAFKFLFARTMNIVMMPTMTMTATRPAIAPTTLSVAGAVMSVPMV